MKYEIRHKTRYRYEEEATFAQCVLRLQPMTMRDQILHEFSLQIDPHPARIEERIGEFGEKVVQVLIDTPHHDLEITAHSVVETRRAPHLSLFQGKSTRQFHDEGFAMADLGPSCPASFLFPTSRTPLSAEITDYARKSFLPDRPVFDAAFELARRIHDDFVYDPKATDVSTAPALAFSKRRGVCQDFAHVMICGIRGLGLPAAYVSGYLRTIPPPGKERLQGADATHAWVSVWCGQEMGWIGIDPTNAMVVQNDHIVLSWGRDYGDVAPIEGVILSGGGQSLKVEVDVIPLTQKARA